jgi:hypothetical protein
MTTIYQKIVAFMAGAAALILSAAPAYADLYNPLDEEFSSIPTFIAGALKALVVVSLPIISLFIVVAGFMFVLARGNEAKLTKAKENLVYVVIGALLILGAWVIATMIGGTVTQLLGK